MALKTFYIGEKSGERRPVDYLQLMRPQPVQGRPAGMRGGIILLKHYTIRAVSIERQPVVLQSTLINK